LSCPATATTRTQSAGGLDQARAATATGSNDIVFSREAASAASIFICRATTIPPHERQTKIGQIVMADTADWTPAWHALIIEEHGALPQPQETTMFTLISCTLRSAMIALVLALVCPVILAGGASAGTKILSGTYSRGQIASACEVAGGTYNEDHAGYGCYTDKGEVHCSNESGHCAASCTKCADALTKKGGITPPPGSNTGNANGTPRAHVASNNKVKPVLAVNHPPLKKFAARANRVH
jgi:hypothetical protein